MNATSVYYTTDGSTPSSTNGTLYTGAFNLTGSPTVPATVNAIAYDASGIASTVDTKTYTFFDGMTIYWDAAGCDVPTLHYFWEGFSTGWPGENMIYTGLEDLYKLTILDRECANLVISCNGANQTEDLVNICGEQCFQNGQWVDCPLTVVDTTIVPPPCPDILDNPGIIASDIYNASNYITSDGMVMNGENVSYKAGNYIRLTANFEVQLGAEFEAIIEDCPASFSPLDAPEGRLAVSKKRVSDEEKRALHNGFEIIEKQGKSVKVLIDVDDDFILQNKRLIVGNRIIDLFEVLPEKVKGQYEILIHTETVFEVKNVFLK